KTAVLNYLKANPVKNEKHLQDICAGFRAAVCETVYAKTLAAAKEFKLKKIVLGGGVSANKLIRKLFSGIEKEGIIPYIPPLKYCTDNAAMIAAAAYYTNKKKIKKVDLKINPSLTIESL
ncbi:MAG: tRNA (adenosine(37)-N6)-threonylcarbamoyltransferase complex transferase subunit TsaD, partial [Elusimicrobia bacterium]|nr:tRNA (adenosine(37)-N6)-threonylcarbamoyltransferase complex transferase subunit TsaD [Elusimicrobiota bacterium]